MTLNQPVGVPFQNPTDYTGPQMNLVPIRRFPREPLITDKKYRVGQMAIIGKEPSTGAEGNLWYLARFESNGDATWMQLAIGSGVPGVDALLTDDGAPAVEPNGSGIIDILGGSGIITFGQDPSTAVTIAVDGSVVTTQYDSDSGSATPTAGVINLLGGTGLSTSAAGNSVTTTLDTPVVVANGGTGRATLPDNQILVGSATAGIDTVNAGTVGQLLVGVTGAIPSFGNSAEGDFTFIRNTAGKRELNITNTNDDNSGSVSTVRIIMGGIAGGLPYLSIEKTANRFWAIGMPNTTNEDLVTRTNPTTATPGTGTECQRISVDGDVNFVSTPCFSAYLATSDDNATGDGTSFILGSGNSLTEVFDQGSNFDNTTGTFTAPVDGRYLFIAEFQVSLIDSSMNQGVSNFETSNRDWRFVFNSPKDMADLALFDRVWFQGSAIVDMDAGDIANVSVQIAGSTQTARVEGAVTPITYYCGHLIA